MRAPKGFDLGKMTCQAVKDLFDNAPQIDNTNILVYIKNHYEKI